MTGRTGLGARLGIMGTFPLGANGLAASRDEDVGVGNTHPASMPAVLGPFDKSNCETVGKLADISNCCARNRPKANSSAGGG